MNRISAYAALLTLLAATLSAEVWETTVGQRIEGTLAGVYGPLVVISDRKTSTVIAAGELKDAELVRVAEFLAAKPAELPLWNSSASKVAKALKGRLQVLHGEKLVDFNPGARNEPEFYLVYFGADWCGPCHAFSPTLVTQYERLKRIAPGKLEVIFVSSDRSASEQLRYVRHVGMPWPVLKFSQLGRAQPIEQWAGKGIPCLVVVTRDGDALLHSYNGNEYLGPQHVLARFEAILRGAEAKDPAVRRSLHRLAVLQHIRAAAGGSVPAAPYVIAMDLRRYRTLETKQIFATLDIDEAGNVSDATLTPELPAVLNHQLIEDARTWLFLPSIENGRPVRKLVMLPLHIGG